MNECMVSFKFFFLEQFHCQKNPKGDLSSLQNVFFIQAENFSKSESVAFNQKFFPRKTLTVPKNRRSFPQ